MVVTNDDKDEIFKLHQYLTFEFEMKQFGDLKYFFGIEIAWSNHGVFLSQWKYILDLLSEIIIFRCKLFETSIE